MKIITAIIIVLIAVFTVYVFITVGNFYKEFEKKQERYQSCLDNYGTKACEEQNLTFYSATEPVFITRAVIRCKMPETRDTNSPYLKTLDFYESELNDCNKIFND